MANDNQIILTDSVGLIAHATTPSDLLRIAIERNVEVDKLEKLLDMQFRFEAQQAKRQYDLAKVGFKKEPSLRIIKSETVSYKTATGTTEYRFPPLDRCCEVIIPLLAGHLISHNWEIGQHENLISVTCVLTHVAGHAEEVTIMGPPDSSGGKNAIQSICSTVSYLERYTLLAVCGVAASDMPQGERSERDEAPAPPLQPKANPFQKLEGDEFQALYKELYRQARTRAEKHQVLDWRNARQKELVQ
jgi:hypothetical protein